MTKALKGWTTDKDVVGILQSRAAITAERGPISKPGGEREVGSWADRAWTAPGE